MIACPVMCVYCLVVRFGILSYAGLSCFSLRLSCVCVAPFYFVFFDFLVFSFVRSFWFSLSVGLLFVDSLACFCIVHARLVGFCTFVSAVARSFVCSFSCLFVWLFASRSFVWFVCWIV